METGTEPKESPKQHTESPLMLQLFALTESLFGESSVLHYTDIMTLFHV